MRFSANLGFLWAELSLPDAIIAAKKAGFDAVKCHWPNAVPADEVRDALDKTGLPMLGLNTEKADSFGLSARPNQITKARQAIDQAVDYGAAIGARNVHVMAGQTHAAAALTTFESNLVDAAGRAKDHGMGILIEPMNGADVPDYFLNSTGKALGVLDDLRLENLKLMLDCYHVARLGENVQATLLNALGHVGHVQFASVPDRAEPDRGILDYVKVFELLDYHSYSGFCGAEYRPTMDMYGSLRWMKSFRNNTH